MLLDKMFKYHCNSLLNVGIPSCVPKSQLGPLTTFAPGNIPSAFILTLLDLLGTGTLEKIYFTNIRQPFIFTNKKL